MNRLFLLGMVFVSLSLVSAFGVSTPYWDDNPLRLAPGESMTVELTLQNMAGEVGDATLRAMMTDDGDGIARLADSNTDYFVPYGSDDVIMKVDVSVPASVERGGMRYVVINFEQVGEEDAGMVSVSGGFTTKFPVYVVAPEESELFEPVVEEEVPASNYGLVWALVILLIVAVAGWVLWKRYR